MSGTLHYELKKAPPELFEHGRWTVLTFLILHGNIRNRCWPSMRYLSERLGMSLPYVTKAKQWLIEHGAMELVSYSQRVGKEREEPKRQHIYQLTGILHFGQMIIHYLYINDSQTDTDDDQRHESSNDQPGESSTGLMINVVDDQRNDALSIPSIESSKPITDTSIEVSGADALPDIQPTVSDIQPETTPSEKSIEIPPPVLQSPPMPPPPLPHVAIVQAYHNALPERVRPPGKPNIGRNAAVAKELSDDGITPDQVKRFVSETYASYTEWARGAPNRPTLMTLEHVKQFIKAWLEKSAPAPKPPNGRPPLPMLVR